MSNPLRNPNIDYERGWFSVTVQVAHNKSVFGAIVGEECELNVLGRAVHEAWLSLPAHTPGLFIDEFVVMPNHFHTALKLTPIAVGGGAREWRGEDNLVASGHCARGLVASGHCARGDARPVISTFTSPEEREVRAKCLRGKRAFVWVCPGGIWDPLPPAIAQACEEGWGFVCSPVPSRTGVNKQRAIWCNQYVIKQAASVWVGSIRPGGSLDTLLNAIKGKEVMR